MLQSNIKRHHTKTDKTRTDVGSRNVAKNYLGAVDEHHAKHVYPLRAKNSSHLDLDIGQSIRVGNYFDHAHALRSHHHIMCMNITNITIKRS